LRFQVNKQRRVIGLGSYPAVSLADARAKAAEVHALIDKGIDPFEARKAAERSGRPVPTFAEIAALVIDDAQARSTNAKVASEISCSQGRSADSHCRTWRC
jgi:hypothetical protein